MNVYITRLADLRSYSNVMQLNRKHIMVNERFVSVSNIMGLLVFERGKIIKEILATVT
jgi:hypothetical protein